MLVPDVPNPTLIAARTSPSSGSSAGDDPDAGCRIGLGRFLLEDEQRALLDGHAGLAGRGQERRRRVVDPLHRPRDVELALTVEDGR